MRVDVEKDIIDTLKTVESATFGGLKSATGHSGQDVRQSLKYLIRNHDRVYVKDVDDGQKYYSMRGGSDDDT